MVIVKQGASIGTDYMGGTTKGHSVKVEKNTIEIIESANREAIEFAYRVERVVAALCGAMPRDNGECASERSEAVFPRLEDRARDVSDRVRSAGYELERLEAIISAGN